MSTKPEVTQTTDIDFPINIRIPAPIASIYMSLRVETAKNLAKLLRNDLGNTWSFSTREGMYYTFLWSKCGRVSFKSTCMSDELFLNRGIAMGLSNKIFSTIQGLLINTMVSDNAVSNHGCRYCKGTGEIVLLTSKVPCECIEAGNKPASGGENDKSRN